MTELFKENNWKIITFLKVAQGTQIPSPRLHQDAPNMQSCQFAKVTRDAAPILEPRFRFATLLGNFRQESVIVPWQLSKIIKLWICQRKTYSSSGECLSLNKIIQKTNWNVRTSPVMSPKISASLIFLTWGALSRTNAVKYPVGNKQKSITKCLFFVQ